MEYTTTQGVPLTIQAMPRKVLDDFVRQRPLPDPPIKEHEIWGGATEEIEDTEDPIYQQQLTIYYLMAAHEQFTLMANYINTTHPWQDDERFIALIDAGIVKGTFVEFLRHVAVNEIDLQFIASELFYMSTTTERGISEASKQYDVRWYNKPVDAWRVKTTPGCFSRLFEDREAAKFGNYTWDAFSSLCGIEQSAIVAHYRQRTRLDYLMSQEIGQRKNGR